MNWQTRYGGVVLGLWMLGGLCMPAWAQLTISTQPTDNTVCEGLNTFFEVRGISGGNAPYTYQWQVDKNDSNGFNDIALNSTSSFLAEVSSVSMTGYKYRVRIKDASGKIQLSEAAKLTVNPTPTILNNPREASFCDGTDATFSCLGRGTGLTYLWYEQPALGNFKSLSQTSQTLTLPAISLPMDKNLYWVEVNNGLCITASRKAKLTVINRPTVRITAPPAVCAPTTVDITASAITQNSDPDIVSYQYYTDALGKNALTTSPPTAITTAGTYYVKGYNNTCYSALTPVEVAINVVPAVSPAVQNAVCSGGSTGIVLSNPNGGNTTQYTWTVSSNSNVTGQSNSTAPVKGTIVQTLTNTSASTQTITYTVTPVAPPCANGTPVNFTVSVKTTPAPSISPSTTSVVACTGKAVAPITLTSTNSAARFRWTYIVPTTVTQSATDPTFPTLETIKPTFSLAQGSLASQSASILITSLIPDDCEGARFTLPVSVRPLPDLAIDPTSVSICSNTNSSIQLSSPTNIVGTQYKWVVTKPVPATVTGATDQETTVAGPLTINLFSTAKTDVSLSYVITASAQGCDGASITLPVTVQAGLSIDTQPADVNVCAGESFALSVISLSAGSLTYQWKFNNTPIEGATSTNYSVSSAKVSHAGAYSVEVSNKCKSISSTAATVAITQDAYFSSASAVAAYPTATSAAIDEPVSFSYTGPQATSLAWTFGDNTGGSDLPTPRHYYYKSGSFTATLTATKSADCFKTFSIPVVIKGPDVKTYTGIESTNYSVYPNPTSDRLFITSDKKINSVEIHTLTGKKIITREVQAKDYTLDVHDWQANYYVLVLKQEDGVRYIKWLKQ